jgi:DedD protein
MAEPADINVDELRRRARRRLVGAIVLALAAAVIVPMLLESDPKPLGEDVSIKIPPVDDGKFVNRLNDANGRNEASAPADSAPGKSIAEAEQAVVAPQPRKSKYDTTIATDKPAGGVPAAAPPAPATGPKSESGAEPKGGSKTATAPPPKAPVPAKSEPKSPVAAKAEPKSPAPAKPESPSPASLEAPRDGFAVQLAAFSDDKGANALANRLKNAGYPAYTEPFTTRRGTLWRVRVGPYPSRDAAGGVRDKLKSEGQNGIVAPAH